LLSAEQSAERGEENQMILYCYQIPPIDVWFGALDGGQLLASAWVGCQEDWGAIASVCGEVAEVKALAESAFRTIGWEGDVREGPYYFALPGETGLSIGHVIKQDNNGNCFVASPRELRHLDSLALKKTSVG
jgi:hypothetical protein